MGLHKGMSNNRAGKPKGATNKITKEMRERVQLIFDSNFDQLQKDIASLEPKDRVKAMTDLLKYLVPALRSMEVTNNDSNIDSLDDEQVITIVRKIIDKR